MSVGEEAAEDSEVAPGVQNGILREPLESEDESMVEEEFEGRVLMGEVKMEAEGSSSRHEATSCLGFGPMSALEEEEGPDSLWRLVATSAVDELPVGFGAEQKWGRSSLGEEEETEQRVRMGHAEMKARVRLRASRHHRWHSSPSWRGYVDHDEWGSVRLCQLSLKTHPKEEKALVMRAGFFLVLSTGGFSGLSFLSNFFLSLSAFFLSFSFSFSLSFFSSRKTWVSGLLTEDISLK